MADQHVIWELCFVLEESCTSRSATEGVLNCLRFLNICGSRKKWRPTICGCLGSESGPQDFRGPGSIFGGQVWCLFLESATESRFYVTMTCFALCPSAAQCGLLCLFYKKKCFWWQRKFYACGPMPCHFFEHPTPACPRPMIDAGQHSLDFLGGTRRLKLDCAMQHCLAVIPSQTASVRRRDVQWL